MSTEQACPWCGSADVIRTIPEKDPFHVMVVCQHCQKVITDQAPTAKLKNAASKRTIEEKTVQLSMHAGKIIAIKYYLTEMNKIPGNHVGLREAKDAVEDLLYARGLTNAVKQPSRNGCVIVLIILVLVVASIIYFYVRR